MMLVKTLKDHGNAFGDIWMKTPKTPPYDCPDDQAAHLAEAGLVEILAEEPAAKPAAKTR